MEPRALSRPSGPRQGRLAHFARSRQAAPRPVLAAVLAAALLHSFACPPAAHSAEFKTGVPVVLGQSYMIPSKRLHDRRRINVYLPEHYSDPERRFPVLYLLDGGEKEDFIHISALAQITAAYGQGQEMIVVGIEGVDRRHDLTSPTFAPSDLKAAPSAGGADQYRDFLVEELRPWVNSMFRTNARSALIGESLAGLFVLETLLTAPGSFDDYIAISPSLWWNNGSAGRLAEDALRRGSFSGRRVWIALETPSPPADQAKKELTLQARLERAFIQAAPKGLEWTLVHSPEGHGTIYHPAAMQALRKLYATAP
jgi:predicted alpha/beta superfamily hydrolase